MCRPDVPLSRRRRNMSTLQERKEVYAVSGEHFDEDGNPISQEEWAVLFGRHDRWRLRNENADVAVSTVYIGLNHEFGLDKPPLIFESLVFVDGDEVECWRYASKSKARAGHGTLWSMYRTKKEWIISDRITPID